MHIYDRLALDIEQRIREDVLRAGDQLPSVRMACKALRLSPSTILKAYYLLESRSLIEARPQSGYYVSPRLLTGLPEPEMTHPVGASIDLKVSDFIFEILEAIKDPAKDKG